MARRPVAMVREAGAGHAADGAPVPTDRSGQPARPPTWERHTIAEIRYSLERIGCSCGTVVQAEPDAVIHDRHEPLAIAFLEHRAAAGAPVRHFRASIHGKRPVDR